MLCCITGPYPIEMMLFQVGKRLDVGLSRLPSSDHIKYAKYVNVYPHGMYVQSMVEQVKLLKH